MTVAELFEYVDEIVENSYSDEVKMIWLNQIEAEIQVDVLLMAVEGIIQYDENTHNATMLAPAPYDQLYQEYLFWRICLAQQEFELADGYAATFNRAYNEYVRFICETINPGAGTAEKLRYYLTAYQIAVKHGYTGTEEEWVLSLKGPAGEPGTGLNILGQVATEAGLPGPDGLAPGTGYLVGSGTTALLYIWNGTDWFYKTQLSGKGEPGDTPEIGANGNWWIGGVDTGVPASGGGGGSSGSDGVSPVVEVTKIAGGHRVTITDVNGTQSFDVKDGETPEKGVHYFTAADKQELVEDVLDALPAAEEARF